MQFTNDIFVRFSELLTRRVELHMYYTRYAAIAVPLFLYHGLRDFCGLQAEIRDAGLKALIAMLHRFRGNRFDASARRQDAMLTCR